jgi:hypothetical protein
MWNGFDTAFIAIFLTYFGLRMKGMLSQDGVSIDLRERHGLTQET